MGPRPFGTLHDIEGLCIPVCGRGNPFPKIGDFCSPAPLERKGVLIESRTLCVLFLLPQIRAQPRLALEHHCGRLAH